jgi:hypothetical protein
LMIANVTETNAIQSPVVVNAENNVNVNE